MRMRKKPNLMPRIERCAHLLVRAPRDMRGRWLEESGFGRLCIEVGCGKGRFTAEVLQGYTAEEKAKFAGRRIRVRSSR